jgi:D-alanyl-D-alanine carboxypeptidase/D-alanyl-D-alanine-endopeptidase (penicillin-binding protein 4)
MTLQPSKSRYWLALYLLVALPATAAAQSVQSRIDAILDGSNLGRAKCGVSVIDLASGGLVAEHNASELMIPASNMKLVTTAAALSVLGKDFEFTTRLELHRQTLVVIGDGDPAFGDPALLAQMGMNVEDLLARWVAAAKRAGVTRVDELVIDDRAFDRQRVHPNWPQDQLHRWYCAEVSGLNFNNNCLDIYASPTRPGEAPTIRVMPNGPPVVFTNAAQTGKRNAFYADRDTGTNRITLRGTVPQPLPNRSTSRSTTRRSCSPRCSATACRTPASPSADSAAPPTRTGSAAASSSPRSSRRSTACSPAATRTLRTCSPRR